MLRAMAMGAYAAVLAVACVQLAMLTGWCDSYTFNIHSRGTEHIELSALSMPRF